MRSFREVVGGLVGTAARACGRFGPKTRAAVVLGVSTLTGGKAFAQTGGGNTVTLPADLTPTGVATKLLTDNAAQIGGIIGIAFVSTLVVAAVHVIRSRFGKKGGSVVK